MFIGPVDMRFGPGIKNTYTVNSLKKEYDVKVYNTYLQSKFINIKNTLAFIFSKKPTIIAVSSGGRKKLLPLAYLKKKIFKKYQYAVITINGYIIQEFSTSHKLRNSLMLKGLKNANRVYVEVEGLKKNLENDYSLNNVFWFPNFKPDEDYIEFSETKNSQQDNDDVLKCAFLARVSLVKGVDVAIEAVEQLKAEGFNVCLDIFGPISPDAQELMSEIDKKSAVKYCGNVPNNEVTNTLKDYNLFLFPTRHKREGFPASLIDAFSAFLPVISADISYNKEIVVDGENGIVTAENDVENMKEAIKYFIANKNKLFTMGKNNFNKAQNFKLSKVFSAFLKDIKENF